MSNVTIISHLSPEEWKKSWNAHVVEDTRENMRAYQSTTSFWGHFKNKNEFILYHHKEYEVKSMSLGTYFVGTIEADPKGSKITGVYQKKKSANLFLGLGAVLCILAVFGSIARQDLEIMITALVLLGILSLSFLIKPKKGRQRLFEYLQEISFDDSFDKKPRRSKRR